MAADGVRTPAGGALGAGQLAGARAALAAALATARAKKIRIALGEEEPEVITRARESSYVWGCCGIFR